VELVIKRKEGFMEAAKAIVITGSSRGFGLAMAREFLQAGCRVTLSGKNPGHLEEAAARFREFNERVFICPADVTVETDLQRLWDESAKKWGRIDIWINNAGVAQASVPVWEIAAEQAARIVQTNITGLIHGTRIALRGMLAQGEGQIFNMEGFGANGAHMKNLTLYGMTKQAVRYFTRGLRREAAKKGILIGAIHPGMMATDFVLGNLPEDPRTRRRLLMILNIIGERPETVARRLAPKILSNQRQGAHFRQATGAKMFWRFLSAPLTGRKIVE
jgi:NAD(P)-dependent dehydrogenase (short-subunit alcohol dehydrogenase family)